jgi:hypothetical protein
MLEGAIELFAINNYINMEKKDNAGSYSASSASKRQAAYSFRRCAQPPTKMFSRPSNTDVFVLRVPIIAQQTVLLV